MERELAEQKSIVSEEKAKQGELKKQVVVVERKLAEQEARGRDGVEQKETMIKAVAKQGGLIGSTGRGGGVRSTAVH